VIGRRASALLLLGLACAACGGGNPTADATPTALQPLPVVSGGGTTAMAAAPAGASPGALTPVTGQAPAGDALQIEQAVLDNIAANGFDSVPGVNGGAGALWINWRTGSDPLATNWNNTPAAECAVRSGVAQCINAPPRTDRLTDLRYLHALALYHNQHPGDARYDAQLARWAGVVKAAWAGAHDERGWTYDALVDLTRLTGDQWYVTTAAGQAKFYSTTVFHASCHCLYYTTPQHPQGYYRPVDTVEEAAALASEGARTGNQAYVQQGHEALQFVLDHGYLRTWHTFPFAWDNVLNTDGSVNPNELFAGGLANGGAEVRAIWSAQEAQTLFHAARVTGDSLYLNLGMELLDALTPAQNTLGLWDTTYSGYCEKVTFSGTSYSNPGTPLIACTKKEAGRQLVVLDAARVGQTVGAGSRYDDLIQRMTALAIGRDYNAAGRGYVYEVARDYSQYSNHGSPEDWVTTEADGIAMEALFALSDSRPW
jgi:hypothetical protein